MQEYIAYGAGVLNAEVQIDTPLDLSSTNQNYSSSESALYSPIPQTPPPPEVECAVTINFPDMHLVGPSRELSYGLITNNPPAYPDLRTYEERQYVVLAPHTDVNCSQVPEKLQPPAFRVHRCHHPGVESGGEGDAFELPFGFPEAIQHIHELPDHVSARGCY